MSAIASQITNLTIVYSTVYSDADLRKKKSKLRVTGLCEGNSLVTGEFPAQRASVAEMCPFDDVIVLDLFQRPPASPCDCTYCDNVKTGGRVPRNLAISVGVIIQKLHHLNRFSIHWSYQVSWFPIIFSLNNCNLVILISITLGSSNDCINMLLPH